MAQHDFVPAWLNFSTPQPSKSPAATFEKHGEHLTRGEGRFGGNRRRHNSSDGFFNNGPLRATGDGWHQPSLLRHDSVDSGVSKGVQLGVLANQGWKDSPGWHGQRLDPVNQRSGSSSSNSSNGGGGTGGGGGGGGGGSSSSSGGHRHWNGNFHPRKNPAFQEKPSTEAKEEKKEEKEEKLQFVEEDFPSLNPEAGKQNNQNKAVGTPAGVWENPPSAKQPVSKMLVIKKVSKEDPGAAFSAGFISSGPLPTNNVKTIAVGPSVYKNLVPKPAALPSKPGPWKPNRSETKPGLLFPGRDSAFTSPVSVAKPVVQASGSIHTSPKESPSSTTPPIEINPSRLMKLTRRSTDKKSEFLKALKDDRNEDVSEHGEISEPRELDKLEEIESSSPEPKENGDEHCHHQNGLSVSPDDGTDHLSCSLEADHLSRSLEAEHRLLKAMGWQEHPENDENYLPLTEDELREFQAKTEQWRKNSFEKNGLLKGRGPTLFAPWKSTFRPGLSEDYNTETSSSSSSSETSDDDA